MESDNMNRLDKEENQNIQSNDADLQNMDVFYDDSVDVESEKKEQKRKPVSIVLDVLVYAFIVYACIYLIPTYVMQRTIVDGPSMENTLHNADQLIVEKVSYYFSELNRFDIIVFYPFGHEVEEEYYVKRVIGLPGETLQIIGSDIYINGEILDEDFGKDPIQFGGWAENPITIGEDEYFVMGDNRNESYDSRAEEIGLVKKENIGGKVVFRIYPLNQIGFLDH